MNGKTRSSLKIHCPSGIYNWNFVSVHQNILRDFLHEPEKYAIHKNFQILTYSLDKVAVNLNSFAYCRQRKLKEVIRMVLPGGWHLQTASWGIIFT